MIKKINLGDPGVSTLTVRQREQMLWRKYSEQMASLGYFVGCHSPLGIPVSDDLRDLFSIYSTPIKFFGNLEFILETTDGYRAYYDYAWRQVYRPLRVVQFDKNGLLCAIDDIHDPLKCTLSNNFRTELLIAADEGACEDHREILRYRGDMGDIEEDLESLDQSWQAPEYKYIIGEEFLQSLYDMPVYKDAFGCEYDIMRGLSYGSLVAHSSVFTSELEDLVDDLLLYLSYPHNIFFLKFSTADTSVMFSVLEELFARPVFDNKALDIKMDEMYTYAQLSVRMLFELSYALSLVLSRYPNSLDGVKFLLDGADKEQVWDEMTRVVGILQKYNIVVKTCSPREYELSVGG